MKIMFSMLIAFVLLMLVWMPVLADDTWCGDSVCPPLDTVPPDSCVALGTCPSEPVQIIYETWCGEDACPPQYVDAPLSDEIAKPNYVRYFSENKKTDKKIYWNHYQLAMPY